MGRPVADGAGLGAEVRPSSAKTSVGFRTKSARRRSRAALRELASECGHGLLRGLLPKTIDADEVDDAFALAEFAGYALVLGALYFKHPRESWRCAIRAIIPERIARLLAPVNGHGISVRRRLLRDSGRRSRPCPAQTADRA